MFKFKQINLFKSTCFFFFKQKTAYEITRRDWSSDVCSDLEIADLCEQVGADVQEVARGMGLDNRIGSKFLHPGPGFGGSCFPKDTLALIRTGEEFDVPLRIVNSVHEINEARKRAMAEKVTDALGGSVAGCTIAILGLTFKPNTDDMREAPSLPMIAAL